ncbi:MAG: polymer-forming cytoskeletal protein [Elusimicrobia bacterium]|nr:polymer-forming cytoskeletal protein [Elusimicrobiota bacterium]
MTLKKLWALGALLAVAGLTQHAWAKKEPRIHIRAQNVQKGDVVVRKGEVRHEDVVVTGSVLIDGTVEGDCSSLGGPVTVNGTVTHDVASMGGGVTINGVVKGDAAAIGGPLRVAGSVGGDAASIGGDVTLEPTAKIGGDVSVTGGTLNRAEGAQVEGEVKQTDLGVAKRILMPLAMRLKYLPDIKARISPLRQVFGFIMFAFFWGGVGLMAALIALFFPKNLQTTAACVESDFWRAGGAGALVILLTFPAFLVMVVSIIGLPLIPLAALLYCAAIFLALAACSLALGRRFCEVRHLPAPTPSAGTAMGFGLLVGFMVLGKLFNVAGMLGAVFGGLFIFVGLLVFCAALIVGLGAVALTRFGSRMAAMKTVPPPPVAPAAPAS